MVSRWVAGRVRVGFRPLERQDLLDDGLLARSGVELGVDDVDLVELTRDVAAHELRGDLVDLLEGRPVLELEVQVRVLDALEAEHARDALAGDLELVRQAALVDRREHPDRLLDDVRVVAAAETAVAADREDADVLRLLAHLEQGVLEVAGGARELGDQLGELVRVRTRSDGAVVRLLEPRGRDHLHRAGDLRDGSGRLSCASGLRRGFAICPSDPGGARAPGATRAGPRWGGYRGSAALPATNALENSPRMRFSSFRVSESLSPRSGFSTSWSRNGPWLSATYLNSSCS